MKLSPEAVAEVKEGWNGVVAMRDRMKTLGVVTFATGGITAPALRDVLYNLPLLLAFEVLKNTLIKARNEKLFTCPEKKTRFKDLMDYAKDQLDWDDWETLRKGVGHRNEIAHDGKLFPGSQCLEEITAVEAQLRKWQLIEGKP